MKKYIAIDPGWMGYIDRDKDSGLSVEDAVGKFQLNHRNNPLFVLTKEEYQRAINRTNKFLKKMILHPEMYPKKLVENYIRNDLNIVRR